MLNPHSLTTTGSRIASYLLHSRIKLRVFIHEGRYILSLFSQLERPSLSLFEDHRSFAGGTQSCRKNPLALHRRNGSDREGEVGKRSVVSEGNRIFFPINENRRLRRRRLGVRISFLRPSD
ncbi:hypothetical protein HanRHA438_Chr13g0587841 [Helianthus annuus]|uniref:Uncharacterized protein n=1 Tax=Helianthus annuus TaxID=4232 RepID=A0A9K3EG35_HELAN|nr:hypothetical protein HanXRQr2_Chr13g0577091 [Helianthus annuus]KAJ0848284.1 hypothetical protein HanPSC8_Chr13g0555331 [Helianthus annuus]KAJ0857249.1 hypothetical protein HanRHA438_Chr13g0587841 [Helianthus annuus]